MPYNPERHHRRSIRLQGYDYTQPGVYFVTIVTQGRECLFGEVMEGTMRLSAAGEIVRDQWDELPRHYPHMELGTFIVMPNHIHAIIVLTDAAPIGAIVGAGLKPAPTATTHPASTTTQPAPTTPAQPMPKRHDLAEIVRAFKTFSARKVNAMRDRPGNPVWQRNYYERIIRNEREWQAIQQYILDSPAQWSVDRENPIGSKPCLP